MDENDKKEGLLKRLKILKIWMKIWKEKIEFDAIEYQEKELEITGKDEKKQDIVYLKVVVNKLFEKCPKSFTKAGKNVLINTAKN